MLEWETHIRSAGRFLKTISRRFFPRDRRHEKPHITGSGSAHAVIRSGEAAASDSQIIYQDVSLPDTFAFTIRISASDRLGRIHYVDYNLVQSIYPFRGSQELNSGLFLLSRRATSGSLRWINWRRRVSDRFRFRRLIEQAKRRAAKLRAPIEP